MISKHRLFDKIFAPLFNGLFELVESKKEAKETEIDLKCAYNKMNNECSIYFKFLLDQENEYGNIIFSNNLDNNKKDDGLIESSKVVDAVVNTMSSNNEKIIDNSIDAKKQFQLIQIKIGMMDGSTILLEEVNSFESIHSLKFHVQNKTNIPSYKQRLFFTKNELVNEETISTYNIKNDSTLYLLVRPLNIIPIYIQTSNQKRIELNVELSEEIRNIKMKINEKLGPSFPQKCLYFNSTQLEDSFKLTDYKIREESTLLLVNSRLESSLENSIEFSRKFRVNNIKIFIKEMNHDAISLNVNPFDSVQNLKTQIQGKIGFPEYKQELIFSGKLLKDSQKLSDYSIQKDSTVYLVFQSNTIQITVKKWNGKCLQLTAKSENKIKDIKMKIFNIEKIPEDRQHLTYKGKHLDDMSELNENKIYNGSIIYLLIRSSFRSQIFIETTTGKLITLKIDANDIVKSVKEKLEKEECIDSSQQILIFDSQVLEDDWPLSKYNIVNECTLQLVIYAQEKLKIVENDLFDPEFDQDYSNISESEKLLNKDCEQHDRSLSWNYVALRVKGKYQNDEWLESNDKDKIWPVVYHGANLNRLEGFCLDGFDLNKLNSLMNEKCHLVTPFFSNTSTLLTKVEIEKEIQIVYLIKSRVKRENIIKRNDNNYWILPNSDDLRPCGICYKIVNLNVCGEYYFSYNNNFQLFFIEDKR